MPAGLRLMRRQGVGEQDGVTRELGREGHPALYGTAKSGW